MPRKKATAPAPRKRNTLDVDKGVLYYAHGDTVHELVFNGLPLPTMMRLAMLGAVGVLQKRRDPMKSWELMRQGVFGRDTRNRKIPLAVRAVAAIADIKPDEALKLWRSASPDERRKLRNDPAVRAMCSQLRAESLSATADAGELKQWLLSRAPS